MSDTSSVSTIDFPNGISLDLTLEGCVFRGIAELRYRGQPLRSPKLPWAFYSESEGEGWGVRFEDFTLEGIDRLDPGEIVLHLKARGRWMPRGQEADAMGEARVRSRRVREPEGLFAWRFREIRERLYENEWAGLAMQISYRGVEAPIHWIMEAATWELEGNADGCTLIQQDVSAIQLEQPVLAGSAFSTIEKFHLDGWGGSYPMDMLPRAAGAAICDFQAKGNLALCLFSERPGLTRARLEKFADENVIHYLDRAYFPLAGEASAPERKLLVYRHPAPLKRHEARNLWLDCFMEVRRRILDSYGFSLEMPEPCTGAHLWDEDLKTRMERWADALERDLPEYARLGYKQAFVHGVWESVTSDPRPVMPGNICCPYAFRFAEAFGGPERMHRLNGTAEAHGLRLMQWFSFHLSRFAPVWKEHPDWVLREANGDPWDGNYQTLWSGRMRSDYGERFKREILDVKDQTGIAGIFWDSYQNLGVTGLDWGAPDRAPQADEIFRMQTELQRRGFRQRVEVVSIFGVSAVAVFGFEGDKFRRRLWDDCRNGDQIFALLDCSPGFFTGGQGITGPGRITPELYFWMAAHRVVPGITGRPWKADAPDPARLPGGEQAEGYARVNHLYNRALPHMLRLRLQEGGAHVLWLDESGNPSVIWCFRDSAEPPSGRWANLETREPVEEGDRLAAGSVYLRADLAS